VCRHSRYAVVRRLIVVIYFPPRGLDSVVSASFQIIPRVMGWLGSKLRVSVTFKSFALKMFVCPVMSLLSRLPSPVPKMSYFSVPSVLSCFRETPEWRRCAVVRRCVFFTDPTVAFICGTAYSHLRKV